MASSLAERIPRGHSALADQLRLAALSVPLNIASLQGAPCVGSVDLVEPNIYWIVESPYAFFVRSK